MSSNARELILSLLMARAPGATICPSEVARAIAAGGTEVAAEDWRDAMPAVHTAVDGLLGEGVVRLSWKGAPLAIRSGPYRIGRAPRC